MHCCLLVSNIIILLPLMQKINYLRILRGFKKDAKKKIIVNFLRKFNLKDFKFQIIKTTDTKQNFPS